MNISESYGIQENAKETNSINSGNELIKRKSIDKTPFTVIKVEESGYFLSMGKYRVSDEFATEKEAIDSTKKMNWELLTNVIMAINTEFENVKNKLDINK